MSNAGIRTTAVELGRVSRGVVVSLSVIWAIMCFAIYRYSVIEWTLHPSFLIPLMLGGAVLFVILGCWRLIGGVWDHGKLAIVESFVIGGCGFLAIYLTYLTCFLPTH